MTWRILGTTRLGRRDYSKLGSLLIYLILSFLFFGRGLLGHLSDRYIGIGTDPGSFMFFLEWWKYVFTHHVNPFFTYLQWAPSGVNLTWNGLIPLFGIFAIPITATLGPVASYNLAMMMAPALAAWTAFLLCWYLRSSFWAAVVGGYVFGFSPYLLAHLLGHLDLVMVFPLPLMVEVTLLRLNDNLKIAPYAALLSILLIAQFFCFPEYVATATIFGAITIAVAWVTAPQWRARLQALMLPTACAYVASAIVLSPYLYYFFAVGQLAFPGGMRSLVSVYPLNFLIPSSVNLAGTFALFPQLLSGHIYETGAYLAMPLLLIVVSFARAHWRECRTRILIVLMIVISVASLGSTLNIPNHRPIPMPWAIAAHLPMLDKALPARFSIYGFLILSIILSLWLSEGVIRKHLRVAGACGVLLFALPNLSAAYWTTPVDTPAFFSTGEFKHHIAPGENVLILPFGDIGNSNIWQATTGFYFHMAGGYLGQPPIPTEYLPFFPIVYDFFNLAESPLSSELLKMFLVQKHVSAIVVADEGAHLWRYRPQPGPLSPEVTEFDSDERTTIRSLFATLGVTPIQVGGVSFYRVPLERMNAYKAIDPSALGARIAAIQLDALVHAAEQYVSDGHRLSNLNPVEAQKLGLLPPRWVSGVAILDSHAPIQNGLVLTSMTNGDVLLGIIASQEILNRLVGSYRPYAKKVEISALSQVAGWTESSRSILLMTYDRQQLSRAADVVSRRETYNHIPVISAADTSSNYPSLLRKGPAVR